MTTLNVAFDCDGCLIDWYQKPNLKVVELIKFFGSNTKNCRVLIWSKRGSDYAQRWVDELDLKDYVWDVGDKKDNWFVDLAFDDEHAFDKAQVNVIVKLNE